MDGWAVRSADLSRSDGLVAAGETIHTESSHKYRPERLEALADAAGWRPMEMWTDPGRLFSVWLLEAR